MDDLEILNTAQEDIDDMLKHRRYDPKWMEAYEICLARSLQTEPDVSSEVVDSK